MQMDNKQFFFEVDSIEESGRFTGYAAVYGNVDGWGRVAAPGCFDEILERFKAEGRYPALLWEHNKNLVIGKMVLTSDTKGLLCQGELYIADGEGVKAIEDAKRAYNLIRESQYGLSFRSPFKYSNTSDNDDALIIEKFDDIYEVSVTAHPANNRAIIESVNSGLDLHRAAEFIRQWQANL